jgi:nitrite reductase (NADH) small subunit
MTSENWMEICQLDELIINDGVNSLVGDQQIAIFRTNEDDKVYAIGNYDPIGKAYVLSRGIVGDIKGEPVVASPLYKQHFSLLTGQCLEDDDVRVPSYPIKVIGGMVNILAKK